MGLLEEINKLNLSDEEKSKLISQYQGEIDPVKAERDSLRARTKQNAVESEIEELSKLGFEEAPGLLAFTRRVLLSADAEEPGAVLLSDNEMGLSGDKATGASGREEISVAGTLRKFIELMPKNSEGQLKIKLSEQIGDNDDEPPASGDSSDSASKSEKAKSNLAKATGKSVTRSTKRYGGVV